jgi:quercetin dioxygenase-like cupin family protein
MIIANENGIEAKPIENPEVKNAAMKVLISPAEGWAGHFMRVIELGADGYTPRHAHQWPHINYILEGQGVLHVDGKDQTVSAGSYAYVPAGSEHQFRNGSEGLFRFICIVPEEGHV